ncbi:MAG: MCE family protein [Deltaproteobacteria bacterium]|nr:MCE family protein [Nannocystaceae bacterium]
MAAIDPTRNFRLTGVIVLLVGLVLFGVLFVVGQQEGTWDKHTKIYADFKTIAGLRVNSKVLLAGVEIGKVQAIDFVQRRQLCDPKTEDFGRYGDVRTDQCDEFLFCAPNGMCAALEPYAAKGVNAPCFTTDDCGEDEICVTADFRKVAKRQTWSGSDGMCARYNTENPRVQVTMNVLDDKLELIGGDSEATIESAGPLGDQMVNIAPGHREPLGEDHRIHATPSFGDNIEMFRERFDGLADKFDSGLAGISSTFTELNDEKAISSVKKTIDKISVTVDDTNRGEGRYGRLLHDESYERSFTAAMRKGREGAIAVDGYVKSGERMFHKVDTDLGPAVDNARKKVATIRGKLAALDDPTSTDALPTLLRDKDGKMLSTVEHMVAQARSSAADTVQIVDRVERGEGGIGRLVHDAKVYNDLDYLIVNLQKSWLVRTFIKIANAVKPETAARRRRDRRRGEQ